MGLGQFRVDYCKGEFCRVLMGCFKGVDAVLKGL